MRSRAVEARTYHSFLRWSGQNDDLTRPGTGAVAPKTQIELFRRPGTTAIAPQRQLKIRHGRRSRHRRPASQKELVPEDFVEVANEAAEARLTTAALVTPSRLCKPGFHHQKPAEALDHQRLPKMSNRAYLAVFRVDSCISSNALPVPRLSVVSKSGNTPSISSAKTSRGSTQPTSTRITTRLGHQGFSLKVDDILRLREEQWNRCGPCNIELLPACLPACLPA